MEYLFSYGTLRQEEVQQATFGRLLEGRSDRLKGYGLSLIEITDPQVLATSNKSHHPILVHTGQEQDQVEGAVFAITADELAQADAYEVADYRRERVTLSSGLQAWVYLDARTGQDSAG